MLQSTLVHIACPCCDADQPEPWARENGFQAVRCGKCSLIYVNPRPSQETITEANKVGVHSGEEGALVVTARRSQKKVTYYRDIFAEFLTSDLRKPVKWLDVGAGYGEILEAAATLVPEGSELIGLEPMAPKAKAAQARGLNVVDQPLDSLGSGYDIISLINVYSHLPDFKAFAADLAAMLKPGGILFLETGNHADLKSRAQFPESQLYLPDHLAFSGVEQMRTMLATAGLTLEQHGGKRADTVVGSLKQTVKGLLKGKVHIQVPYTSPFRQTFYKARKPA